MLGLSGLSLLWAGEGLRLRPRADLGGASSTCSPAWSATRRRERRYGGYGAAIEGYELRFADEQKALEAKLPEDELDNPAHASSSLSAYEHDADDDGRRSARLVRAAASSASRDWRDEFARPHDALN